jgi:hypothetical protein
LWSQRKKTEESEEDSSVDSKDSSVESKDSSVESKETKKSASGCVEDNKPLEDSKTDDGEPERDQDVGNTDPTTPKESKVPKEDKCNGHTNLFDFLFKENRQKFEDAKCMKCCATFMQKETKPSSSRPIHFCPNFEIVCDAVLCHGWNMELNSDTISTRHRQNRNKTV